MSHELKFLWAGIAEIVEASTVTRESLVFQYKTGKQVKVEYFKIQTTRGDLRWQETSYTTMMVHSGELVIPVEDISKILHRAVAYLQSIKIDVKNLPKDF